MKYNKLVRDNIPEIMRKDGSVPAAHTASDEEFWLKLKEKLREETEEFIGHENEEELADILEVIDAICEHKGIDKKKLERLRKEKANERGGFKKRIILEHVE